MVGAPIATLRWPGVGWCRTEFGRDLLTAHFFAKKALYGSKLATLAFADKCNGFTIGIGTPEGAPIQIGGEFIKDDKGEMVVSKLGEPLLEKIAQATDGAYIRSTNQSIGLDEIVRTINNMEKGDLAALRFEEFNEQFQYLIGAALVLLLLEFLLLDRRNPLLRRFNIFGTDTEK